VREVWMLWEVEVKLKKKDEKLMGVGKVLLLNQMEVVIQIQNDSEI
jgi:hypothetical protein